MHLPVGGKSGSIGVMQLQPYFDRIGFSGRAIADLETLSALLRRHALSVTFENLDVQLGTRLDTSPEAAYDKIVGRKRGGWCYEQNGLFGAMLKEIGFGVTRMSAAVMLEDRGPRALDNHLTLLVEIPGIETRYLADVGFGGSLLGPIPLCEGDDEHAPFRVGLRQLDEVDRWRFWEDAGDGEFSFDFSAKDANEEALAAKCVDLQTNPESSFVLNLVAQRRYENEHVTLRGRVLSTVSPDGACKRMLASVDELLHELESRFGLNEPGIGDLWPQICARHTELFGTTQ